MQSVNFNDMGLEGVEPHKEFSPIPKGLYLAALVEQELRATRDGSSKYFALCFEILEGDHKGRKVYENLHPFNASQKAVDIAKAKIVALRRATNMMTANQMQELVRIPLCVSVACVKREDEPGEYENRINAFYPKAKLTETAAKPAGQTASSGGAPLWARG